jgi:hypothetical protein
MNSIEKIKYIKRGRHDISDYLIHFIRDEGKKSSFEILIDIINDGKILCGWAVRNGKRTIFGDKPAVCFTDMPLYSFNNYVTKRGDKTKVDFYGIALPKKKMFDLGARNVIYGTSYEGNEEEKKGDGSDEMNNPNLPLNEQYRYMLTQINDTNDWTHEREWRWTNYLSKSKGNYLPIWKINEYDAYFDGDIEFYQEQGIFIIVRYENEIDRLQNIFSTFKDEAIYNRPNIDRTYAVSLEKLSACGRLAYDKLDFISLLKDKICTKIKV